MLRSPEHLQRFQHCTSSPSHPGPPFPPWSARTAPRTIGHLGAFQQSGNSLARSLGVSATTNNSSAGGSLIMLLQHFLIVLIEIFRSTSTTISRRIKKVLRYCQNKNCTCITSKCNTVLAQAIPSRYAWGCEGTGAAQQQRQQQGNSW